MKFYTNKVINFAMMLACIPTVLFFTWYKVELSIVAIMLSGVCGYSFVKRNNSAHNQTYVYISKKVLLFIVLFMTSVSFFSGVGGWFPQSGDNIARNPIFFDLIMEDWPVVYSEMDTGLTYYLGFWLLPALIGKLFGQSFWAGNIALTLQVAIYLVVAALLVICWLQCNSEKMQVLSTIMLIIFSGINYIGLVVENIFAAEPASIVGVTTEAYAHLVGCLYVGNFVAIRQTFNHFIPVLLVVCIFVCTRDRKSYVFMGMLTMIVSPFAMIALAITMIIETIYCTTKECRICGGSDKRRNINVFVSKYKELFSLTNICALLLIFIIMPYYMGRETILGIVRNEEWFVTSSWDNMLYCIGIMFAECGLLIMILWKICKGDILYRISAFFLLIIPFFRLKDGVELQLKPTVVWLIILMLLLLRSFKEQLEGNNIKRTLIVASYILLCAINFMFEAGCILRLVYKYGTTEIKKYSVESFSDYRTRDSFTYIGNYIKRNPNADFYFSNLSRADFNEIDKIDIILDDRKTIAEVICDDEDYSNVLSMLCLTEEQLFKTGKNKNDLWNFDLSKYNLAIDTIVEKAGNKYNGKIVRDDLAGSYKTTRFSANNPYFVHIMFENIGSTIFPEEYTGKRIGIGYAFYNAKGEMVGEIAEKQINCILLTGENTELTIPLTNAPKGNGIFTLKMWIYQGMDFQSEILLERDVVFE